MGWLVSDRPLTHEPGEPAGQSGSASVGAYRRLSRNVDEKVKLFSREWRKREPLPPRPVARQG